MNNTSLIFLLLISVFSSYSQYTYITKEKPEPVNNWSFNLTFSDNGFGFGASKYFNINKDISLITGLFLSSAKDDREFEQSDIFGNSVTPFKQNRLFLLPVLNIGAQYRMFRENVTDEMRPYINFALSPSAVVYTPYSESFLTSFKYARAKYTVGGFIGVGLDYLSSKKSALGFNIRYYYIGLFGSGVKSLSTNEKKQFGGIYFVFSYNFLK